MYGALAQAHKLALVPFLLDQVALNPALMQPDGLHPNAARPAVVAGQCLAQTRAAAARRTRRGSPRSNRRTGGRGYGQVLVIAVSARRARRHRSVRDRLAQGADRGRLRRAMRDRDRLSQHGHGHDLPRARCALARLRCLAAAARRAQAAAIASPSCCRTCCSIRSRCSVPCAPASWSSIPTRSIPPASSSTSSRIRARSRSWCWRTLRPRSSRRCPSTNVRHVIVTGVGDLLDWPKGAIVNFVLRHVQKKVPRVADSRGARLSPGARARAATLPLLPVTLRSQRSRLPAVHRRHHRRRQGRDAHARQHGGQHPAVRAPGSSRLRSSSVTLCLRAAALSHLLAHRELPAVRLARRHRAADRQPARLRRLRQGAAPRIRRCSSWA